MVRDLKGILTPDSVVAEVHHAPPKLATHELWFWSDVELPVWAIPPKRAPYPIWSEVPAIHKSNLPQKQYSKSDQRFQSDESAEQPSPQVWRPQESNEPQHGLVECRPPVQQSLHSTPQFNHVQWRFDRSFIRSQQCFRSK